MNSKLTAGQLNSHLRPFSLTCPYIYFSSTILQMKSYKREAYFLFHELNWSLSDFLEFQAREWKQFEQCWNITSDQ